MAPTMILVLAMALCGTSCGGPVELTASADKRSAFNVFGGEFSHSVPMFAAVSLHPPMPVLHIVSNSPLPLGQNALASSSAQRYARPPPSTHYAQHYASSPGSYGAPSHDTILYAKPDSYGGYTYYKKPRVLPPFPKKKRNQPVILRIHKYRTIRDR